MTINNTVVVCVAYTNANSNVISNDCNNFHNYSLH